MSACSYEELNRSNHIYLFVSVFSLKEGNRDKNIAKSFVRNYVDAKASADFVCFGCCSVKVRFPWQLNNHLTCGVEVKVHDHEQIQMTRGHLESREEITETVKIYTTEVSLHMKLHLWRALLIES